jgi:hypothetical protein
MFAEKISAEILAPPHRHWTFYIPRVLRGLFERERSLRRHAVPSFAPAVGVTQTKEATMTNLTTDNIHFTMDSND